MKTLTLLSVAAVALTIPSASAATLYQQNFEGSAAGSSASTPGSYTAISDIQGTGWQIQGGTGSGSVSFAAGVNNSGVGGSQALFGTWDLSGGVDYTWNQYTFYGVGGAGAAAGMGDILVALDILINGSDNNSPLSVSVLQNGGAIERIFTPTLANGQYTHVEFTLDQTTGPATFDPTAGFWFRLSHGNGGFGFDANNTVQVDNIMISVVPEPATGALLALGAAGLAAFRRRA
ncbi:MAG TPA: PEP-CTERM sorting domain-containing protein [Verrucomicrobiae bacterium]|nr:PEP-CTERM sorting domain-containing protein [Verrucomicrobiae bacterium]